MSQSKSDTQKIDYSASSFGPDYQEKIVEEGRNILPLLLAHDKQNYFIHLCTSMYRRDEVMRLLDEYGDFMTDPVWPCEDYQLEVLLASKGKICYEPDCVLNYRVGHSSLSSEENYDKNVNFAGKVLLMTEELRNLTGITEIPGDNYAKRVMRYIALNTFRSEKRETRNFFMTLYNERSGMSGRGFVPALVRLLTSNKRLWKFTRTLWTKLH